MAQNTLESVWVVWVSNALGWHFICWFPSLYILDYLVPPYYKILDPPLYSISYLAAVIMIYHI